MTKSRNIFLALLLAVFFLWGTTPSFAALYYGPIVMVAANPLDSNVQGDLDVTFVITQLSNATWTVGEMIGGVFSPFTGPEVTKQGGDIVDLAIKNDASIFSLSEKIHSVDFIGKPNTGTVLAPLWVDTWYDDAIVTWSVLGEAIFNFSIVNTDGDPDGLAAVPIPGALLLLGSGLIGFIGLRRKLGAKK